MDLNRRIVVEGNDGTGKTTLVNSLRLLGFTNVHDRGEMSAATLDPSVQPVPGTTYILLECDWETSKERLIAADRNMTEKWHTDEALRYYLKAFRNLYKFNALVVWSDKDPHITLYRALRDMGVSFRVGMPSGRLVDKGVDRFRAPFLLVSPDSDRSFVKSTPHLTSVWARSKTYPQMVALGCLDMAVVGRDALEGNPYASQVEVIQSVKQRGDRGQPIRMVIAGREPFLPDKPLIRVVTPFPEWAQKVFGGRGIPHTIFPVSGGSEALVAAGIGDVLFDVVETFSTLRENRLDIITEVDTLDLCVIRRRNP